MISVCLATFNSEKYIIEQINSILPQLSKEDEIVISDDGSSDDTISIIQDLHDERIIITHNHGEHGYTPNFENALAHSKGEYLFLSDHDDVWFPNKVEVCIKELQKNDFVVSDAKVTSSNLEVIEDSYFHKRVVYRNWLGNLYKFGYLGCCMAMKRNVVEKALPFPKDYIKCTHDNWLFIVAKTFFHVKIVNEPLIYYRRHDTTTSAGGENEHKSFMFRIEYRTYLLTQLLTRFCRTYLVKKP